MNDMIEYSARADGIEIEKLLKAVLQRYAVLFPDWEVSTVSFQKNGDRNGQIDQFISLLTKMKTP